MIRSVFFLAFFFLASCESGSFKPANLNSSFSSSLESQTSKTCEHVENWNRLKEINKLSKSKDFTVYKNNIFTNNTALFKSVLENKNTNLSIHAIKNLDDKFYNQELHYSFLDQVIQLKGSRYDFNNYSLDSKYILKTGNEEGYYSHLNKDLVCKKCGNKKYLHYKNKTKGCKLFLDIKESKSDKFLVKEAFKVQKIYKSKKDNTFYVELLSVSQEHKKSKLIYLKHTPDLENEVDGAGVDFVDFDAGDGCCLGLLALCCCCCVGDCLF